VNTDIQETALPACFRVDGDALIVRVRVFPRSHGNAISGIANGQLRVQTTTAPTDGKANRAVARILADAFGVAPSGVSLRHGSKNRDKVFAISGFREVPEFCHR
jgi:uncharacterized protein (TIGR00251 family)